MIPLQEQAEVIDRTQLSESLFRFRLKCPSIAAEARAGQFVEIDPGDKFFLRRPFSIQRADNGIIVLLIKTVGMGTEALVRKEGKWDIIGPLGNSFCLKDGYTPVLVGGGVGVAPLIFFADELRKSNRKFRFILGAKSEKEIPATKGDPLFPLLQIATDDGSRGYAGTVVDYLHEFSNGLEKPFIHACGPKPMLKALRELMILKGWKGEFSLESRMACGIGICQGCAVPVKDGFALVCKDGPVFPFDYINGVYWE